MATLYEISSNLADVITNGFVVDEETGEILFDESDMESLEADLNDKLEACALFVKNLDAEAEAIKKEERILAERRKSKEAKSDRLRSYMINCMRMSDISKLDTPRACVSIRKSSRVEIHDAGMLYKMHPELFTESEPKPDKAAIKRFIKANGNFSGIAEIVESQNIRVK